MTRADLINLVHNKVDGLRRIDVEKSIDSVITSVVASLARGERTAVSGFGIFSSSLRKERVGRNPQTGNEITIPESTVVKFSPGKAYKEAVNPKVIVAEKVEEPKPPEHIKDKPQTKKKKV